MCTKNYLKHKGKTKSKAAQFYFFKANQSTLVISVVNKQGVYVETCTAMNTVAG